MYDKLEKCPLCNSTDLRNAIICKDYFLSGESFAISLCENCKLLFTNPRPIESLLSNYYQSENYVSHANKGNTPINTIYRLIRRYTIHRKVKLINQYSAKGTILDFGCGTGQFLNACMLNGWEISGIEPSQKAREQAVKLNGKYIHSDINSMSETSSFDVITLWHVLEHVYDLNMIIGKLIRLLSKSGVMFIALPNNRSWDANHYKEFWAAYDVPRHLYHFNQESFRNLCELYSLKLKSVIPMKFDAYYISLLSEKYKFGRANYFKSFINGSLSNGYAKRNNNNYSSLIYVIKK